jgi:hypothetical protein
LDESGPPPELSGNPALKEPDGARTDRTPADARANVDEQGNPLRPMTAGLMTRLFAVPAIIVAVVITCAMVVTLAFGWIAESQERPIGKLIETLAAGSGEKVGGVMLLPREKEMWQAALELSRRLENPEEIPAEERPEAAAKLSAALASAVDYPQPYSEATRNRIGLMAIALGRLGEPAAVDRFASMLEHAVPLVRLAAVRGLAELGPIPETRSRIAVLYPVLHDDSASEVRMLAATAIGQIAPVGDERAIRELRGQLVDGDEVRWNVALALARLGDDGGKLDILDMLSREYWAGRQIQDDPDAPQTRPISEAEIARNLSSTLLSLDRLHDPEIRSAVLVLKDDRNPSVAREARSTIERWDS